MKRSKGRRGFGTSPVALLAALCLVTLACATPDERADRKRAQCRPAFPYQDGWLGGDAAYSVALPAPGGGHERPTLWLFGDSFVSQTPTSDRRGAAFVHNSIGLSRCGEQGFEIEYHWGHDDEGEPTAFFHSGHESPYWWLFDGFVHEGALYVGLLELEDAAPDPVLEMPIRMTGMKLVRIENPHEAPSQWRFALATLLRSERAFPGGAMVIEGDHVYFFTFTRLERGQQPRLLLRLPLTALSPFPSDLSPELETWVAGGHWKAGWQPDHALPIMTDNATEMSVERHETAGKWIAIYGSPIQTQADGAPAPDGALSDQVFLRHATHLEGPWSERELLYRIPEMSRVARGEGDPNTVCYAAKGHDSFAPPGGLLITYVCNLRSMKDDDPYAVIRRLQTDMNLYRPVVVQPEPPPRFRAECTRPVSNLWDAVSDCLVIP